MPIRSKRIMRLLLLIFSALLSGQSDAQRILDYSDYRFTYRLSIDSSGEQDCFVNSITIIRKSNNLVVQTIDAPENSFWCDGVSFQLLDVNFDHQHDFTIAPPMPHLVNVCSYYWTFDPQKNRFYRDTLLEEICPTDFNPKKKVVTSRRRAFCCDVGIHTYKIVAGRPVEMESIESAVDYSDSSRYIVTKRKRIRGKMSIVSRKFERR